jgi:uncharacterized membrane protein
VKEKLTSRSNDGLSHDSGRLRVDLFSDAVFAVAITLLVLNLPLTGASGSLWGALADRWPAFAAFAISFVLIGCLWVSHFRLFRLIDGVDGPLLFLNLAVLFFVVLLPFSSSTLATFVTRSGTQSHLAAALFAGNLVLMGLTFGALYLHVAKRADVSAGIAIASRGRLGQLLPMMGVLVNAIGVGVAFISPVAVLAMVGALSIYYVVDELTGAFSGVGSISEPQRESATTPLR